MFYFQQLELCSLADSHIWAVTRLDNAISTQHLSEMYVWDSSDVTSSIYKSGISCMLLC